MRSRHLGLVLFARYVAISLVPVLLLGTAVDLYTRHQVRAQKVAAATKQSEAVVTAAFTPFADQLGGATGAPNPLLALPLQQVTEQAQRSGLLRGLRLWNPDGHLVWAGGELVDHPASVTERAFYDAAAGTSATVGGWPDGTGPLDAASADEVLTVYVPIRTAAGASPALVAEVVGSLDQTGLDEAQQRLRLVLMAAVATLWLTLAALTRSTTSKLSRNAGALRELALYDPLTGLANRRHFTDEAGRTFAALGEHGQPVAVVLLDLLGFTQINSALGRGYGDELLRYVAQRLQSVIQPGQLVARIGGDVFALLLPGVDGHTALSQLEVVRQALSAEVEVSGIPVSFEAVIGVASFPVDGTDADTVLQRADLAMGAAKDAEAPARLYGPELEQGDPARLGLAVELRRAIANGELFLVYQPKIDLVDLGVRSVEALVRWNHPERGPVSPAQFVPMAESTGLIVPLTAWVLDNAIAQAAYWAYNGMPLRVAINVSPRNLRDELFPDQVVRCLLKHQLPADYIELEITETAILTEPERAARTIRRLRDAGVAVALDDFGQGATSLAHLRNLRLSTLKIDKSFIDNLCTDGVDASIVYSMITLGHQLGLEVVAEGVEDEAQYAALASWGCDVAQGFHFSRPLTVAQLQKRFGRPPVPAVPAMSATPAMPATPAAPAVAVHAEHPHAAASGHPGAPPLVQQR